MEEPGRSKVSLHLKSQLRTPAEREASMQRQLPTLLALWALAWRAVAGRQLASEGEQPQTITVLGHKP